MVSAYGLMNCFEQRAVRDSNKFVGHFFTMIQMHVFEAIGRKKDGKGIRKRTLRWIHEKTLEISKNRRNCVKISFISSKNSALNANHINSFLRFQSNLCSIYIFKRPSSMNSYKCKDVINILLSLSTSNIMKQTSAIF